MVLLVIWQNITEAAAPLSSGKKDVESLWPLLSMADN